MSLKSSALILELHSRMRFLTLFFLYIFFFSSLNVLADDKIVFLDLNYVLKESTSGKRILKDLEKLNNKNLELIDNDALKLKKKEQEIVKLKNIISATEFNKKISLLKEDLNEHNKKKTNNY